MRQAKLIVLLRDPVRRAYSHYWHGRDKRRELLSFGDAGDADVERLGNSIAGSRSFARGQFLVLRFEDLARDPIGILNVTLDFLGLPRTEALLGRPMLWQA